MNKLARRKALLITISIMLILMLNSMLIANNLLTFKSETNPASSSESSDYIFDWYDDWGSTYSETGSDTIVDSDDFIYICGNADTTGLGDYDMVLIKYNTLGVEQWARTWGGPDDDISNCLALDDSNNIYIAGYTNNAGDTNGDIVIVKYDSSGNYQLNVTWGGSAYDGATGIVRDSSGNFYVAGITKSFADADGDSVLIKFDSSLSQIWNTTWGGSLADNTNDVEMDSEGYIYVAGHSDSMDPSAGETDNYILKYDSSGILQWAKDWDASWSQRGMDLAIDSNNNLYLIGYTFGHPASSMKGLLLKYDKNGNYQWYRTFGPSGVYGNSWRAITILPNDDIYIGGYTITNGVSTNGDSILLNYDTSGNLNWYKAWGSTGLESIYGLTYDSESNIYGTGHSTSVGAGAEDIVILKYLNSSQINPNPNPNPQPPPDLSFLLYIIIGVIVVLSGIIYLKVIRPKALLKRGIRKDDLDEQPRILGQKLVSGKLERDRLEQIRSMRELEGRRKIEFENQKRLDEEKVIIGKIRIIMNVSTRIKMDLFRNYLKMDEKLFNIKVIDWADKFGFTIDGDYLNIVKENVSDFIDELEKQFKGWRNSEGDHSNKI